MERRVLIGYWSRKKEDHDAIAWRISRYQRRTKKSKKDTLFEHSTATVFGDFALIRGCGIRRSFERGEHTVARRGRGARVNQRSNKQPWVIHGKVSPQPIPTRETEGESAAVGQSVPNSVQTHLPDYGSTSPDGTWSNVAPSWSNACSPCCLCTARSSKEKTNKRELYWPPTWRACAVLFQIFHAVY